jgi:putative spermidine/putrescine transport system ATP-binding protein
LTAAEAGAVELRGVRKEFGAVVALHRIDLTITPGEFLTLLGPSGSGKTTLLRLVAGFERLTEGAIVLDGRNVARLSPAQRNIGVVFQHYALFPHLTVADNIGYGLKLRGVRGQARRETVERMLGLVRLSGYERRYPRELSGGQQQRVAVARALAFAPRLLLMDEPLGALDRALRGELEEELRRIHAEIGTTMVYVTHDQEEALAMSDRIAIMRDGRIVQTGTPEELYDQPVEEFVARFLGECNVLASEHGDPSRARVVRPERLRLESRAGDVAIAGRLDDMIYLGQSTRLRLTMADGTRLTARLDPRSVHGLAPGDEVTLHFAPADCVQVARAGAAA